MNAKLALIAVGLLFVAAPTLAAPTLAPGRPAQCNVTSGDGRYDGPCRFTPTGKGSFSVSAPKFRRLMGATDISVYPIGGGKAEVRGLTSDGINSRWGEATRSKTNKACWIGTDFKVCAR